MGGLGMAATSGTSGPPCKVNTCCPKHGCSEEMRRGNGYPHTPMVLAVGGREIAVVVVHRGVSNGAGLGQHRLRKGPVLGMASTAQ